MKSDLVVLTTCMWVAACAALGSVDRAAVADHASALAACHMAAEQANAACKADGGAACDGPARAAYAACKADGGL